MQKKKSYGGSLTREQFLFYEMRVTAKLMVQGLSDEQIIDKIVEENLFQFPTEKTIKNLAKVCIKRLHVLNNDVLIDIVANGPSDSAKQICLYAMMKQYGLVWEFMTSVIGEKYKIKDFSYSKKDINVFFSRLQEQNEEVANWSELTIMKIKQVLTRILVANGYLENTKSEVLNPVLIDPVLKSILIENKEYGGLSAFNCFGGYL